MTPDISVVSGTWNRLPLLQKMVKSVRASIVKGLTFEIVLVDGGSTDGTQAWCKMQPDIRLIEQGRLLGAIRAYADGFKAARGRYVIIANDDLIFDNLSMTVAHAFMQTNPAVGIGCFYTDRHRDVRVDLMPAIAPDGKTVSAIYGGVIIIPRWLGNRLSWWDLPNARTYGGDNALCARCYEAGWKVAAIPGTLVRESIPHDELNRINNELPGPGRNHPDTDAYHAVYPHGPKIRADRLFGPPEGWSQSNRILYAPIYEENHAVQHEQKYGLRQALQRLGAVYEVDYMATGAESILRMAGIAKPQLVVLQLHGPEPFTEAHMIRLRNLLPTAKIVNWCGDVYDMTEHPKYADAYVAMLRHVDLHTVVNETAMDNFIARGVNCRYWQLGYEPEGVGHEPAATDPRYEVIFLGNGYSANRHRFGDFFKTLTARVDVFGLWWPMLDAQPPTLYDFRAGCRLYRAARLALGDSEWAHTARGFVSNRAFQAMAAGGCLMMQQAFDGSELVGLVDGKHWVLWADYEDLRAKIDYYLAHEDERRRISAAGHIEVLLNHSFEKRVAELLPMLRATRTALGLDSSQVLASEPGNGDPTLRAFHEVRRG